MSLFQSNLRKQIRNLPKILNFVKIIHYYSKLFTSLLRHPAGRQGGRQPGGLRDRGRRLELRERDGAGHVGRAIVEIVQHLCCQLYWVDTQENRFPEIIPIGVTKICASSPSHIAARASENSIHLVMTYSHQIDYDVVSCLLNDGNFARCGLIGSETKAARFRSRLRNAGVASEQIERLVCPIGLGEIQGKAPCQIALVIAW